MVGMVRVRRDSVQTLRSPSEILEMETWRGFLPTALRRSNRSKKTLACVPTGSSEVLLDVVEKDTSPLAGSLTGPCEAGGGVRFTEEAETQRDE